MPFSRHPCPENQAQTHLAVILESLGHFLVPKGAPRPQNDLPKEPPDPKITPKMIPRTMRNAAKCFQDGF